MKGPISSGAFVILGSSLMKRIVKKKSLTLFKFSLAIANTQRSWNHLSILARGGCEGDKGIKQRGGGPVSHLLLCIAADLITLCQGACVYNFHSVTTWGSWELWEEQGM